MTLMKTNGCFRVIFLACAVFAFGNAPTHAGPEPDPKKLIQEPESDTWEFKLALPSWIAAIRGDGGVNGSTSHSNIGFNELANKIDMVASLRAEAGYGRFGLMADFSYLSVSDSVGKKGVIRGIDFQEDQILGDLGLRWRLVDAPRGWLDVIGGVRYTYIYTEIGLHSNSQAIGEAANRLAVAGALLRARVVQELIALSGREPNFAQIPIGAGEAERLIRAINRIEGNIAERREKIEKLLDRALNRRLSRVDDWFDPYIGLRGRYNFNDKMYFVGRADISPFDVGADFAWQASAGFGCYLTPRIYGELVYRIMDVDYRHDGLIYDMTTHGPELTLGMQF